MREPHAQACGSFFWRVFIARLVAPHSARYRLFFEVRRSVAGIQDAPAVAAMDASTCRGGVRAHARCVQMKKVSSECAHLSARVHLRRFSCFQMKVKILKSH
jgi:hypothetical protein